MSYYDMFNMSLKHSQMIKMMALLPNFIKLWTLSIHQTFMLMENVYKFTRLDGKNFI